jgi:hypothetical protein
VAVLSVILGGFLQRSPQNELALGDALRDHLRGRKCPHLAHFHFTQLTLLQVSVLKKVLEWCFQHKNALAPIQDDDADSRKKTTDIEEWDQKFMQVDQKMLFEFILVAVSDLSSSTSTSLN